MKKSDRSAKKEGWQFPIVKVDKHGYFEMRWRSAHCKLNRRSGGPTYASMLFDYKKDWHEDLMLAEMVRPEEEYSSIGASESCCLIMLNHASQKYEATCVRYPGKKAEEAGDYPVKRPSHTRRAESALANLRALLAPIEKQYKKLTRMLVSHETGMFLPSEMGIDIDEAEKDIGATSAMHYVDKYGVTDDEEEEMNEEEIAAKEAACRYTKRFS